MSQFSGGSNVPGTFEWRFALDCPETIVQASRWRSRRRHTPGGKIVRDDCMMPRSVRGRRSHASCRTPSAQDPARAAAATGRGKLAGERDSGLNAASSFRLSGRTTCQSRNLENRSRPLVFQTLSQHRAAEGPADEKCDGRCSTQIKCANYLALSWVASASQITALFRRRQQSGEPIGC
jgi:hypothetical protein